MEIEPKTIVAGIFLVLLGAGEKLLPLYSEFPKGMRHKVGHDARNPALGAGNALLMAVLFGAAFVAVEVWADDRSVGLLRMLDAPGWLALGFALLFFDLWEKV